ncbi:hypothetical protein PIIN_08389 [Serendipita indica DSM 11827]|uniref:Uncharacterized protein n=1 Tax=Serendipita indica (strain DSM 11827) TaxID=1109443 RepID=G4TSZ3_SERID|nr:hypothetical protein PIIN_08389 [Serendipita indica DSM 11827]
MIKSHKSTVTVALIIAESEKHRPPSTALWTPSESTLPRDSGSYLTDLLSMSHPNGRSTNIRLGTKLGDRACCAVNRRRLPSFVTLVLSEWFSPQDFKLIALAVSVWLSDQ